MRKILISKGFGAGWSSWQYDIPTKFACEYQPLIEAIESGSSSKIEKALDQYKKDVLEKFDMKPYLGGISGLTVVEIGDNEKYAIDEYDGAESIITKSKMEWN